MFFIVLERAGRILNGLQLLKILLFPSYLKTGITFACFRLSGTMPVTKDWCITCSIGMVTSCMVSCTNFVDKLLKSSLLFIFSV